jgi:hypothetical protein
VSSLLDHPRILLSRLGKGNNGAEMQNIGYADALSSRGPAAEKACIGAFNRMQQTIN